MAISLVLALLDVADANELAARAAADPNSLAGKYSQVRADPDKKEASPRSNLRSFLCHTRGPEN